MSLIQPEPPRRHPPRLPRGSLVILGLGLLAGRAHGYETEGGSMAAAILERSLKTERSTDRVSMKVDTVIEMPGKGGPVQQNAQVWIRRDGTLVECQGVYLYDETMKKKSNRFRSMITADRYMLSSTLLANRSENKPPIVEGGTSLQRMQYFFRVFGVPHYGGFLDGYFGGTGDKRILEQMLAGTTESRANPEQVGGVACDVVQASTPFGMITAWVSTGEGNPILKLRYIKKKGDQMGDGDRLGVAPPTPPGGEKPNYLVGQSYDLDDVAVAKVGEFVLPIAGRLIIRDDYSDGTSNTVTYRAQRREIDLHPNFEGTDAFKMDFPNGTVVFDWDHKQSGLRYIWKDGKITPTHADFAADGAANSFKRPGSTHLGFLALNIVVVIGLAVWLLYLGMRARPRSDLEEGDLDHESVSPGH